MIAISPEALQSIFSGLVLLVGALATFTASRSRRIVEDQKALRRQFRDLQRKYLAAVGHLFLLEVELAERSIRVPGRPAILESDPDDDETPAVPSPPAAGGGNAG